MGAGYKAASYEPLAGHIFQPNLDMLKQNLFIEARTIMDPILKAEETFEAVKWNANPGVDTQKTNEIKMETDAEIERLAQKRLQNPDDRKTSAELRSLAYDYQRRFTSGDIYQINKRYEDLRSAKENILKNTKLDSERKQKYIDILDNASLDPAQKKYEILEDFNIPVYPNVKWSEEIYKNYENARQEKDKDVESSVGGNKIKTTYTTQRFGQDVALDAPLYFLQQMGVLYNQNKEQFIQEHNLRFKDWSSINYALSNMSPNTMGRLDADSLSDEDLYKLESLKEKGIINIIENRITGRPKEIYFNPYSEDPLAIEGSNFQQKVMPEYKMRSKTQTHSGDINISLDPSKDDVQRVRNHIPVDAIVSEQRLYDLWREVNPKLVEKMKLGTKLSSEQMDKLFTNDVSLEWGGGNREIENERFNQKSSVYEGSNTYVYFILDGKPYHSTVKDLLTGDEGKTERTNLNSTKVVVSITNFDLDEVFYLKGMRSDDTRQVKYGSIKVKRKIETYSEYVKTEIKKTEEDVSSVRIIFTADKNKNDMLPLIFKYSEEYGKY